MVKRLEQYHKNVSAVKGYYTSILKVASSLLLSSLELSDTNVYEP